MKSVTFLLAALFSLRFSAASQTPNLQSDPDTIASCVEWYDNNEGLICEEARDYWGITAEHFTSWNPSVSLDCAPWRTTQSYCIVTQERLDNSTKPTTTSESAFATSTATTTLGPSPASWTALGCYFDDFEDLPVLETRVSKEGDAELTISRCQDTCYTGAFTFAGVKAGSECWCSSFVGGEHARNSSDCNMPCGGNQDEICGGAESINVFEPVEGDDGPVYTTSTATVTTSVTLSAGSQTGGVVDDSTSTSGASRNFALF
ncbi:WSC domain-containing protein [Aspergillus californicus]